MTKIKVLEGGKSPVRATEGAGCFDVFAREIKYSKEKGYLEIFLGFKAEVDKGYVMELAPRSSISDKGLFLCNGIGQIDSDFRGEVRARFYPVLVPQLIEAIMKGVNRIEDYMMSIFKTGDAVAQFKIVKEENDSVDFTENELSETKRGEGGFGSTTKEI